MAGLTDETARPIILLDLDVGGRVLRVATDSVTVTDGAGETWGYISGLTWEPLGQASDIDTMDLALVGVGIDWALQQARGVALEQRRAVVRLYYPGQVLEQCRVLIDGLTSAVSIEYDEMSCTIEDGESERSGVLPVPQARVDGVTWGQVTGANYDVSPDSIGQSYQIVIGYPGNREQGFGGSGHPEPAVPIIFAETDPAVSPAAPLLLFADGEINAGTARVWNMSLVESIDYALSETTDGLGRVVTSLSLATGFDPGTELWYGLQDDGTYGGGLEWEGQVLRGLGDVIRWVYTYSRVPFDFGRARAWGEYLNRYKVDTWLNTPTKLIDWLKDEILSAVQVSQVQGPHGRYYVPLRWWSTPGDAVAHLDVDAGEWTRVAPLTHLGDPIRNEITVEYRLSQGDRYLSRRVVTAEGQRFLNLQGEAALPYVPWYATTEEDARIIGSALARQSQAAYGVRPHTLTLPWCWDDTTAQLLAQDYLERHAWPKRSTQLQGPASAARALSVGDIVLVSEARMHLDERPAIVLDVVTDAVVTRLDVVLLDRPLAEARSTAAG